MATQQFAARIGVRVGLVVACGVVVGACALPKGGIFGDEEDPRAFSTLDTDGDSVVSPSEFTSWGREQGLLGGLMEQDGGVTDMGAAETFYGLWRPKGEGLTEPAFSDALATWFPDAEDQAFNDWDLDQNGTVEQMELEAGFAHTALLDEWDANGDGTVDADEALARYYEVFDADRNGNVTEPEFNSAIARWGWDL